MKKLIVITGLVTAISTSLCGYADEAYEEDVSHSVGMSEASVSGLGAVIGGFAAGPIGVIIGAASGMSLGHTLEKGYQYDDLLVSHEQAEKQLIQVRKQLVALQDEQKYRQQQEQAMHALAMTRLELQLLFRTNQGSLSEENKERLDELAEFLHNNPQLHVRLHGYADPRGEESYNQQLSQERSQSVWQGLLARGVAPERIEWRAHGEANHALDSGDVDAYALERRVTIEVYDDTNDGQVAVRH